MPLCFLKYRISYYILCTAYFYMKVYRQKEDVCFKNITKKNIKPSSTES